MHLCKVRLPGDAIRVGSVANGWVRFLDFKDHAAFRSLSDVLHADHPAEVARQLIDPLATPVPLVDLTLLPPIDGQEVWAAGVTYKRSQEARERESVGAARFYDAVYSSPRPELFFKSVADRVVGPGAAVHIRRDSRWSVPEPELALVLSPRLRIIGYTIGNDMSARDIEGENPLYLPQAKVYDRSCALGPVITLAEAMPRLDQVQIDLTIERAGRPLFEGRTTTGAMNRGCEELADWLGRENSFPGGAVLLTGTGIVPPDDFSLSVGDVIHIEVTGIGRLTNRVEWRALAAG